MAFVATSTVWPGYYGFGAGSSFGTIATIDANGEMFAFIGHVWNKDRATKDIRAVGFRFGAVTKTNGSTLLVSLQDVDATNGPPGRPDGTPDQSITIANADAGFTSNVWYQTGALSADRTVAFGELVAVVIGFDSFVAGDSVILQAQALTLQQAGSFANTFTGGAWAISARVANVVLEFDDGTFGCLMGHPPSSSVLQTAFNSGSAADERALKFTIPFTCKVDALWAVCGIGSAAGGTADLVLYDGTSALATVSLDDDQVAQSGVGLYQVPISEQTLTAGTIYYVSLKPTSTNNVTHTQFELANANHAQAWPGGTIAHLATRVDGGAWSATTTSIPYMGIHISALSDTSTSGGGVTPLGNGLHPIGTGVGA